VCTHAPGPVSVGEQTPRQERSFPGDTFRHAMLRVRTSYLRSATTSLLLSFTIACQGSRETTRDSTVARAKADSVQRAHRVVPDGFVRIFDGSFAQADILMVCFADSLTQRRRDSILALFRAVVVEPESEKTGPWTIVRVPARRSGPALDSIAEKLRGQPGVTCSNPNVAVDSPYP
jgi:hypothetical protein